MNHPGPPTSHQQPVPDQTINKMSIACSIHYVVGMAPSIAKRDSPAEADRASRPSADPTRDRILDAALDLFFERSFDGATTREIAQRAGVTQPLLNYHYRSKDDLWRAAVDSLDRKSTRLNSSH